MSMTVNILRDFGGGVLARQITITTEEEWKDFQAICNRAGNCWDRSGPRIKEFIDVVTNGKAMQDYYSIEGKSRPKSYPT